MQNLINKMQYEVQKYFKNILNLPCPDFRANIKDKVYCEECEKEISKSEYRFSDEYFWRGAMTCEECTKKIENNL